MAMTNTDSITLRLAAACGLLGQYAARATPASSSSSAALHQPDAFVQPPAGPNNGNNNAQQLTIFYGGMVVVVDGCTPEKAAELIRLAAAVAGQQGAPAPAPALVGTPIARTASLRRFLSKRKDRATTTTAPGSEPAPVMPFPEPAAKKGKLLEVSSEEATPWLALGSLAWDDPCITRRL